MTTDTKTMLDIVRRIATHLKEEDGPRGMGAGGHGSWGAEEQRREGAEEQGSLGAGKLGSRGAGEQRSAGAKEQGREGAGERGFTIPEMLITAVMVGGAAALIATAIYQVFIVAQDGNARLTVLGDVENAAIWIGRDASEAQAFTPGSGRVYGVLATSDPTIQYRYRYNAANNALVRQLLVSGVVQNRIRIARATSPIKGT